MVVLALILLVLVAVLVVAMLVSNPQTYDLSIFGAVVPANALGIFLTGAIAMAVTIVALLLLRMGIRRARVRRQQLKALEASGEGATSASTRPVESSTTTTTDTKSSTTPATSAATEPEAATEKSALDLQDQSSTTAAERRAMLDEADQLTRDEPQK
jgi:flagellar biosynthesis/type III secretory pathway M-ring protein FliF/YscJ